MSSEKIENTLLEIKTPDQKPLPEVSQEVLQEEYNKLLRRKALSVYTNSHLQHKLSEHFRRKKSTESQSTIKNNADQGGDEDGDTAGEAIKETTHEQRYRLVFLNFHLLGKQSTFWVNKGGRVKSHEKVQKNVISGYFCDIRDMLEKPVCTLGSCPI